MDLVLDAPNNGKRTKFSSQGADRTQSALCKKSRDEKRRKERMGKGDARKRSDGETPEEG